MTGERASGLDLGRLVKPKRRGGRIVAQCPACAAAGADKSCEHLVIFDDGAGKWGCVAYAGDIAHRREIAALVGEKTDRALRRPPMVARVEPKRRELLLPALCVPSVGELAALATLRRLPFFAGLEIAVRAGVLRVAQMTDYGELVTAWVLLDDAKIAAQARRLDGKPWEGIGGAKAKTLPGSQASWPIGAAAIGAKPFVALCEGGPDTLAAWSLAWWHGKASEIAPLCMAGAGQRIHADALSLLRGKGVYVFPHRDNAGARAQSVWTEQLREAGALWVKPFDVSPAGDLNDWLTAAVENLEDCQ